jgi:dTDP-4-dehydrorhamnose 3,5-epimerase
MRSGAHLGHVAVELSGRDARMLWIPPGFAHGYLTLEAGSEVVYMTTEEYAPALERCLRWNDPELAIPWPLQGEPQLAPKDAKAPGLKDGPLPTRWS